MSRNKSLVALYSLKETAFPCARYIKLWSFCCMGVNAGSVCAPSSSSCSQPYHLLISVWPHLSLWSHQVSVHSTLHKHRPWKCFSDTWAKALHQHQAAFPCRVLEASSRQMESEKGVPAFLCPWWSFSIFPARLPWDPGEVFITSGPNLRPARWQQVHSGLSFLASCSSTLVLLDSLQ